jgi:hypothetical protein
MFLPNFLQKHRTEKMTYYSFGGIKDFYTIDIKILRKLKLKNLDNTISDDDKIFLEYLLNENFVAIYSTKEEVRHILEQN